MTAAPHFSFEFLDEPKARADDGQLDLLEASNDDASLAAPRLTEPLERGASPILEPTPTHQPHRTLRFIGLATAAAFVIAVSALAWQLHATFHIG